jgi:hypothetical protein
MRRLITLALAGTLAVLGLASSAAAATITNGTVTLGVNPSGSINDRATEVGLLFNGTGNDGTFPGCPCEGWGAGAGGPTQFQAAANEDAGNVGFQPGAFTFTGATARSVVDILRGDTPALRLTQDFHPSPTTPNLYEITTTLENISDGPLTDVRYERVMDWDIEPTAEQEFVTINRGSSPPDALIYSDDSGFADGLPFEAPDPIDPAAVNASYVKKGPGDQGARFRFSFGTLAAGEQKQFFLYYGAAGDEADANAAVSAAALEMFSYGQPSQPDGPDADTLPDPTPGGTPNTFIWGFRAVGGSAVIPPTLSLTPESGASDVGGSHGLTAKLTDSSGAPVPGAKIVFGVAGANPTGGAGTTDGSGQAGFGYTGTSAGDDTITACLDADNSGGCDADEVTDTATQHWNAPVQTPDPEPPLPVPEVGKSVVVGVVSGTIRIKERNGGFRTLRANDSIPLGSTVDATKGKVRLTSAANKSGATQSALFFQGAFVVTQTRGAKPITQLALAGKLSCAKKKKGRRATASAKRKKVRRLWGDGKGRFRTKGKHGAATVRGTKWLTEDRCNGTLVRVKRGKVSVRDFTKRKTVLVKKGHSYFARSR